VRLQDAAVRIAYVGVSTSQRALRPAAGAVALARRGEVVVRRRAAEQLGETTIILVDRGLDWRYIDMAVQRVIESALAERTVVRALERIDWKRVLDSPAAERVATQVVESRVVQDAIGRVVEDTIDRLRDSPAMWTLLDEIMHSPAVAEAIAQQGMGFADQVGDEVRERSRTVDDKLERAAWRLLRRRPRPAAEAPSP
jgi:hypothetical protein